MSDMPHMYLMSGLHLMPVPATCVRFALMCGVGTGLYPAWGWALIWALYPPLYASVPWRRVCPF